MKYFLVAISCFFAVNQMLLAEEVIDSPKSYQTDTLPDGTVVYLNPDTFASFPGGDVEMRKFIGQNLRWPKGMEEIDIVGKVYLRIVIRENGEITDIEVTRSLHPLFDNEAIRVVRLLPNFIPAKVKGKNVATYFTIPIIFKML
jgi:protein TonB